MKKKSMYRRTHKVSLIVDYTGLVYQQTHSLTRTARFLIRAVFHWTATIDWLAFIEARPVLARVPDGIKRVLADKIHRPFARHGLRVAERTALLMQHYTCMEDAFSPDVLLDMVCGKRFHLAQLKGRQERNVYAITISRNMYLHQQGEITISFLDVATNMALAQLIVNIARDRLGRRILLVSGMQGPAPVYKEKIAFATRDLCGLRPKRAALEAVCALAKWLSVDHIVATGRSNHVSQTRRKWRNKIFANYDGFWREFAPEILADGDYRLSISLPRRQAEDVAGRKRKEWRGRCAYLDAITADASRSLASLSTIAEEEENLQPADLRISA